MFFVRSNCSSNAMRDPRDYYVEIYNDDESHSIRIAAHDSFGAALGEYERLTKQPPALRVVMRHRAHVYRQHIPDRLRLARDRRD